MNPANHGPSWTYCSIGAALFLIAGVCRGAAAEQAGSADDDAGQPQPSIRVEHDADAFVATVSIRAAGGEVAWLDVLRGIARARGYDDTALAGIAAERRFNITSKRFYATRLALNLGLGKHVRLAVTPAADPGDEPYLTITLDRQALLASQRRIKDLLRRAWLRRRPTGKHYGLTFPDAWGRAPAAGHLVVVVHGLDSCPENVAELSNTIRDAGFSCATFRYPNDQPIADSARLLANELSTLARSHPGWRISLVTRSMGGLVARAVVEDPQLDPGNVRQLIMIVPPNQGSALARFGFALDLAEHLADKARRNDTRLFYALVEDGMSEAAMDLRPDSPCLRRLNARARNPLIRYTIFLGDSAPLHAADLSTLRDRIARAGDRSRWVRFFGTRAEQWLEDLDEVVDGKGDGAVSLQRGRLAGVDDTVVLRMGHLSGLHTPRRQAVEQLHRELLQRLERAPPEFEQAAPVQHTDSAATP